MKSKLTLLAAAILVGVGATIANAGSEGSRPQVPAADKPAAGMSCCSMGHKGHEASADKNADAAGGMSCHSAGQASKEGVATGAKSCCK